MKSRIEDQTVTGIDIGSRSIELVVLNGTVISRQLKTPTAFDPLGNAGD